MAIRAVKEKQERQQRKEQRSKPPLKQPIRCEVYTNPAQAIKASDLRVD